jgi:hypothetical protein
MSEVSREERAMVDFENIDVVVAGTDASGRTVFLDPGAPARLSIADAVEAAWVWETGEGACLPCDIGTPAQGMDFPGPGGTKFGVMCFPARSAGKLDLHDSLGDGAEAMTGNTPGMHRSDTIDYEVILSGKVDIVLPDGARRTLGPGSLLVMGGVGHAWENHYDEPCFYAAVVIGLRSA